MTLNHSNQQNQPLELFTQHIEHFQIRVTSMCQTLAVARRNSITEMTNCPHFNSKAINTLRPEISQHLNSLNEAILTQLQDLFSSVLKAELEMIYLEVDESMKTGKAILNTKLVRKEAQLIEKLSKVSPQLQNDIQRLDREIQNSLSKNDLNIRGRLLKTINLEEIAKKSLGSLRAKTFMEEAASGEIPLETLLRGALRNYNEIKLRLTMDGKTLQNLKYCNKLKEQLRKIKAETSEIDMKINVLLNNKSKKNKDLKKISIFKQVTTPEIIFNDPSPKTTKTIRKESSLLRESQSLKSIPRITQRCCQATNLQSKLKVEGIERKIFTNLRFELFSKH